MKLVKDLLKEIKKHKNIIIYGAGDVSSLTLKFLKKEKQENKIISIAVTDIKNNKKKSENYKICNITDMIQHKEESLVIIATLELYHKEIKCLLKSLKFKYIYEINQSLYNYMNIHVKLNHSRKLYICEGYYHVLISLIKIQIGKENADIMLTNGLDKNNDLISKLIKSNVVYNVIKFSKGSVNEYISKSRIKERIIGFKKNIIFFEKQFAINLEHYTGGIFLFFDNNKIGRYIQSKKINYTLIEDCFEFMNLIMPEKYKNITNEWGNLTYKIERFFGIGYFPFGQSKYCKVIEVNSQVEIQNIKKNKIKILPREYIFNKLSLEQKKKLYFIFVNNNLDLKQTSKNNILILTQPLYIDGFVSSEKIQKTIYSRIIEEALKEGDVYIKPHPRDLFEYSKIDSKLIILDKNVPTEVYNFMDEVLFEKAITINSTAIYNMNFVKKKVFLGMDYISNFEGKFTL